MEEVDCYLTFEELVNPVYQLICIGSSFYLSTCTYVQPLKERSHDAVKILHATAKI